LLQVLPESTFIFPWTAKIDLCPHFSLKIINNVAINLQNKTKLSESGNDSYYDDSNYLYFMTTFLAVKILKSVNQLFWTKKWENVGKKLIK